MRAATAAKPEMIIEGLNIIGNAKSYYISRDPLTVQQGIDRFKAQGFRANLQTGEYEFDHIEVLFDVQSVKIKLYFN